MFILILSHYDLWTKYGLNSGRRCAIYFRTTPSLSRWKGDLLISWKTNDDPFRPNKRAAPIYLRFERALMDDMQRATPRQREILAAREVDTVKAGLWGYQPDDPLHNARFIVVG